MMEEAFVLFGGLPVGLRTLAGIKESWKPVGETEAFETLNGMTQVLRPAWRQKWEITVSSDGERRWAPDVDLLEPGARVVYHGLERWKQRVLPGDTDAFLLRDPSPGSVAATDAIDESAHVAFGLAGRHVTIFGRARHTRVSYRPILACIVTDCDLGSSGRDSSWSLTLREEVAP